MTKTITEKDLTLKDLSLINAIQKNKSIDVFKRSFAISKYGSEKSYDGTFYEHDSTFHTWDVAVDLMNLLDNDDGTIGEMNRLLDLIYNVDTTSFQFYNKIGEGTPVLDRVARTMFFYDGSAKSYDKILMFVHDHLDVKKVFLTAVAGIPVMNISFSDKKTIQISEGQYIVISPVTKEILVGYGDIKNRFRIASKEDLQFIHGGDLVEKAK